MHFTRPRELIVAWLVGLAVVYLVFQAAYGSLPELPTAAGVTLGVLAVVEVIVAFSVRARVREARVVPAALMVARAVALAKASSLAGALVLGGWLGALGYLVPRGSTLTAAAHDVYAAVFGAVCAAALVAAALWLEHCCRTPREPHHRDQDRPGSATG